MAGIGDLIVKLKLNGTEFKKGLDKAGKDITSSFKNIKAGVMAVWSGIGAAAVSTLSNIAHLTQQMGDEWDRTVFKMKNTWSTFWRIDATGEYKNFFARFKAAIQDAENLYNSRDAQFEANAGTGLTRAVDSQEMNKLRVKMQDQTKTMEERNAAAERYLELLKDITTLEEMNAKEAAEGELAGWLGAAGMSGKYSMDQIVEFVRYLGNSSFRKLALGDLTGGNGLKMSDLLRTFKAKLTLSDVMGIASAWNANNDESTDPMIKALKAYYSSRGAYDQESYRIQQLLNRNAASTSGVSAGISTPKASVVDPMFETIAEDCYAMLADSEFQAGCDKMLEAFKTAGAANGGDTILAGVIDFAEKMADEVDNQWLEDAFNEEALKEKIQAFQALAAEFRDACISGFVDGSQYVADSLAGLEDFNAGTLVSKLLTPLADIAIKEGEMLIATGVGVEALKEALTTLQGPAALAAGAALVAIGTAAKAGLSRLASSGGASASTATTSSSSSSGSTDINSSLTIYVKGSISGSDIVLSGSKTIDKWNR